MDVRQRSPQFIAVAVSVAVTHCIAPQLSPDCARTSGIWWLAPDSPELLASDGVILREMRLALSVAGSAALLLVGFFALFALGIVHAGNRPLSACPTPTPFPSQSRLAPGVTGAAGMQLQTAQTAPPYVPPTPPIVVAGHMTVTRENAGQTVTVPPGTVIDVVLVNGRWSTPTASGGLTPLSTQRSCNRDVSATFRAYHAGQITSEFDTFEVGYHFVLKVLVIQ